MPEINLLLHHYPREVAVSDMVAIQENVQKIAPEISVSILRTDRYQPVGMLKTLSRRTVSVELGRAKKFRCLRGRHYQQWRSTAKSVEYELLDKAGIPIPDWSPIPPDSKFGVDDWGKYIVVKPNHGLRGAYVRVMRTGRVRYRDPEDLDEDNPGRNGGLIAQRFIYTGRWPISYRVSTLFGTPLAALRYDGKKDLPPVDGRSDFRKASGASIVATATGCSISLEFDPEILDLARRTHAVFPEIPVLGIDIVRDADDSRLWVLETNPFANTWVLGSSGGRRIMAENNIDIYSQFNGLYAAAESLVDLCKRSGDTSEMNMRVHK